MPNLRGARQYFRDGEYDAAREIVEAALRENSHNREALALMRDLAGVDRQLPAVVESSRSETSTEQPPSFEDEIVAQATQIMNGLSVTYRPSPLVIAVVFIIGVVAIFILFQMTGGVTNAPPPITPPADISLVLPNTISIINGMGPGTQCLFMFGIVVTTFRFIGWALSFLNNKEL